LKRPRPAAVGEVLAELKKSSKLGEHLEHARIWEHWEELAGTQLSAHGRPMAVKDKQLRIEVESAVWMHKFSYRKWHLIKRINRMARKELVNDVFFVLLPDGESMDDEPREEAS